MAKKPAALAGTISINLDREPDLPKDADRLTLAAATLTVTDEFTYERAADLLKSAVQRITTVEEFFEDSKSLAFKLHKSITSKIAFLTGPYRKVRETLEGKMKVYRLAQDEATKKATEEIQASGTELKQELEKRAEDARMVGNIKLAKELEAQAATVIVDVVLPDSRPDVEGIGERRPWKGKIRNEMELIVAVAEGRYPLMVTIIKKSGEVVEMPILEINQSVVDYICKRTEKDTKIPGIDAYEDLDFSVSRKGAA